MNNSNDLIRQFLPWDLITDPIWSSAGAQHSPTSERIAKARRFSFRALWGIVLLAGRWEPEKVSLKPSGGRHLQCSGEELQWTSISGILGWNVATKQLLLVLVISVALMQGILLLMGLATNGELILLPWTIVGTVFGILVALMLLAVLVLGNRQVMEITVNEEGMRYRIGARARSISRMAIIFGGISGSVRTVGAGLLAQSRETGFFRWSEVTRVRVNLRRRSLVLFGDSLPLIEVFCTPEVLAPVLDTVRRKVERVDGC